MKELTDQEIREGFEALRWFQQNSSKFFEAVLWPEIKGGKYGDKH